MGLIIQWERQTCPQTVTTQSAQGQDEGTQVLEGPGGGGGITLRLEGSERISWRRGHLTQPGGFREGCLEEGTLELRPG